MHSIYNEGKSAAAERFIRILKNKISNNTTVVLKNAYFDVLSDIVNNDNNTYHRRKK